MALCTSLIVLGLSVYWYVNQQQKPIPVRIRKNHR